MATLFRYRHIAVLFLFITMCSSSLFGQRFHRTIFRRTVRQPAVVTLSAEEAKMQLLQLAGDIKSAPRPLTEKDLSLCLKLLFNAVNDLQRRLPREFDKDVADDWRTTFLLTKLKTTLDGAVSGSTEPDYAILEAVQQAFLSDKEGVRWVVFEPLRTALQRYQNVAQMLKQGNYESQMTNVCNNLSSYVDKYGVGNDPLYFVALSDVVLWLDYISPFEPRAARLAELTRTACTGINFRVRIGEDFIGAGFHREINQTLEINETIDGTNITGEGTLVGESSAELIQASNRAAIKIRAKAFMESYTDGRQHPVTLKNRTTGTLRGEKHILFSAEEIATRSARSGANLNSQISNIRIDAGPIIRLLARGQIELQREDSNDEASRRAANRMSNELNEQVDSRIAELDAKYQKIKGALSKAGLFPREWNLSSTTSEVDWSILVGNVYQPSAPLPAPVVKPTNGLVVQVHQSALNNILATLLSGRMIDEEKFSRRVEEFFEESPDFLKRKTDETPAKVSFGPRAPVDVLFVDNKIRVVVRLSDIQVMDNQSRSFVVSVEYQIKMEKIDGQDIIVLERTEAEALPAGYGQGGSSLSTAQTIIRSYIMRRLEVLPERYESEPLYLGGEWAGVGRLIPQRASAEKGWLTLVWDWESDQKK